MERGRYYHDNICNDASLAGAAVTADIEVSLASAEDSDDAYLDSLMAASSSAPKNDIERTRQLQEEKEEEQYIADACGSFAVFIKGTNDCSRVYGV